MVLGDTTILVLAAVWGAWSDPFGLWVWTGLCLAWMRDTLLLAGRHGLLFGLGAALAVPVPWIFAAGTWKPTLWVAGAALAALLVALAISALRPLLRWLPRRLRRGGVAYLSVTAVLVAAAAGAVHAGAPWQALAAALLTWNGDLLRFASLRRAAPRWLGEVVSLVGLGTWAWAVRVA